MARTRARGYGRNVKPIRQPKVFKSEDRASIKTKKALLEKRIFKIDQETQLPEAQVGCMGTIRPGTIIRLATKKTTPAGPLYFFDGYYLKNRELTWIGEFDTLHLAYIAAHCGEEITEERYDKILVPDASGVLSEMIGSMIGDEE